MHQLDFIIVTVMDRRFETVDRLLAELRYATRSLRYLKNRGMVSFQLVLISSRYSKRDDDFMLFFSELFNIKDNIVDAHGITKTRALSRYFLLCSILKSTKLNNISNQKFTYSSKWSSITWRIANNNNCKRPTKRCNSINFLRNE